MKEMINRSNYETFFIDYFDGRLDKIRVDELHDFLDANPDLRAEFDIFSSIPARPDNSIVFEGKERLKRDTITLFNYKSWLIASMENDLDANQELELDAFIRDNSWIAEERELFKMTKLSADSKTVYDKKNNLKKGGRVISLTSFMRPVAAAAAVVALLFFANYLRKRNENVQPVVAEKPSERKPVNNSMDSVKHNVINQSEKPLITQEKAKPVKPVEKDKVNFKVGLPENSLAVKEKNPVNSVLPFEGPSLEEENQPVAEELEKRKDIIESELPVVKAGSRWDTLNIAFNIHFAEMKVSKPLVSILKGSDVFSEEDLKEFRENEEENKTTDSKSLVQYAAKELKQLAKTASISIEKESDTESQSTTYALVFGNNFSISHIKGK